VQAQRPVQFVAGRIIVLAFALLAALLLASALGYAIRGGSISPTSTAGAPMTTVHFQQMTDNQMDRAKVRAEASPTLTSPYGVGH
jgi:hypothetical protein